MYEIKCLDAKKRRNRLEDLKSEIIKVRARISFQDYFTNMHAIFKDREETGRIVCVGTDGQLCACEELLAPTTGVFLLGCCGRRLHRLCMQQWRPWIIMKENGETTRNVRMECECGDLPFFEGAETSPPKLLPLDQRQLWTCSSLKQPEFFILD